MLVQEYLDKHLLSRKIEDAVNAAVRAKSSDPVLFIVSIQLFIYSSFSHIYFTFYLSFITVCAYE